MGDAPHALSLLPNMHAPLEGSEGMNRLNLKIRGATKGFALSILFHHDEDKIKFKQDLITWLSIKTALRYQ